MKTHPNHRFRGRLPHAIAAVWFLAAVAALPSHAAPSGGSESPITASRFGLSIDGVSIASFSELQGITSQVDVIESGGGQSRLMKITLKRGLTRDLEMASWHELVILGDVAAARKSCTLTMFSATGDPVLRYNLTDAWPSKIEIGSLTDKSGASVLTETITLTCEFIERVR